VKRFSPIGTVPPPAWEYQWNLGDIITAICGAGLRVERLEEYPEQFWPKLACIPDDELARLPHTFCLVASSPTA
jgi:hypothetical protein